MTKTAYAGNGAIWGNKPPVSTRNPAIAKIHALLFVQKTLDILPKVVPSWRIELGVVGVSPVEVVEHCKERRLKVR
jgi:hypothetical protein